MNFETYLNQAWNDHANESQKVAAGFLSAISLIETTEQLAQLANLVTHVMGEHLAEWQDGVKILTTFSTNPHCLSKGETEKLLQRSVAVLELGKNKDHDVSEFSVSDRIRIMAAAASALAERDSGRAHKLFYNSLHLAEMGLDAKDPANRALAIAGNNLACIFEEKKNRSESDSELMILAAHTGRKYWELAGTWEEVTIAEYRLAMTYIQAKDGSRSRQHAQNSIELRRENKASDRFMFFGYQALALAEKLNANDFGFHQAAQEAKQYFEKLSTDDKSYCEAGLKSLN